MPWIDAPTPWGALVVTPGSAALGLAVLCGWYVTLYGNDARTRRELSERYAAAVIAAGVASTMARILGAPPELWPALAGVAPLVALGVRDANTPLARALDQLAPALGLALLALAPDLGVRVIVAAWILLLNFALRAGRSPGLRFSLTWLSALPLALWP